MPNLSQKRQRVLEISLKNFSLTTLNVICDAEAVSHRCALKHQGYYPQQCAIHGEKWIPVTNGERAVRNLRERLRLSLTWPRLHAHWNIKRTPHTDLNAIAYDAIDHAFQNVPSARHRWFVKHVARFGPVGPASTHIGILKERPTRT